MNLRQKQRALLCMHSPLPKFTINPGKCEEFPAVFPPAAHQTHHTFELENYACYPDFVIFVCKKKSKFLDTFTIIYMYC